MDPFFRKYKWIRYTYDFGDDWRHKIMIEKIDETSCFAFDPDETIQKKASPMTKKVDAWKKLYEDAKLEKLKLSEPKYTQRELLRALDNQEASDYSCGEIRKSSWQKNAVAAALMVGLCNFQEKADAGELSFALDIKPLLKKITSKMQKDTYRRIKKFSENMEAMLRVYGMLELEDAYKIFCTLYDKNQDKTEFYRYVYWYGSFNCIFKTAYTDDGRCFSFIEDIDSQKVIAMQEKYAADMDYASFSIEDIRLLSENLANRTEWSNGKSDITANAEVWMAISGIMLELELPMLKGRSRTEYAKEKNMSPWSVDMVSNHTAVFSDKKLHMYEFPKSVQEWMYNACEFGESHEIQKLFNLKNRKMYA